MPYIPIYGTLVCTKTAIVGNTHADADVSMVDAWERLTRRLDAVRRARRSSCASDVRGYGINTLLCMAVVYAAFGAGGRG